MSGSEGVTIMWNSAMSVALVLVLLSLPGCDEDTVDPDETALLGGVLATFSVRGEVFRVWITNESTIQQVFDLRDGTGQATIPNGPLLEGPGQGNHNEPWSWHLDPGQTQLAETTIEVCDGRPSAVEADLDYWMESVRRYCPWSASLEGVRDYR
jgi:hypothetical protein